jgi:hypothetical protein
MNQPVNANLNPSSAGAILQPVDPFAIDLCLFDAHGDSVAHRLQMSSMSPLEGAGEPRAEYHAG